MGLAIYLKVLEEAYHAEERILEEFTSLRNSL